MKNIRFKSYVFSRAYFPFNRFSVGFMRVKSFPCPCNNVLHTMYKENRIIMRLLSYLQILYVYYSWLSRISSSCLISCLTVSRSASEYFLVSDSFSTALTLFFSAAILLVFRFRLLLVSAMAVL